jgi:hypothetical protein
MSENNKLKWRVQHKTGTAEDWGKAKNFVPLEGELIIYSDLNKIKLGDGKTNVNDLEFASAETAIQVDENNSIVIGNGSSNGDYSVAEGKNTVAGCKGYYIAAIDYENRHIYLHTGSDEVIPTWDNPSSFYDAGFNSGYTVYKGDVNGDGILS